MEKPVISVIVPVYNVMKYIRQCLDSICAQTFSALEIILVDDGSTDESGSICDEYAKKDERIRVVHQENQGLSAARNKGLELASCDFVGFIDSDDWIEPDTYQVLYNNLCVADADISTCALDNAPFDANTSVEPIVYSREEAMYAALSNPFFGVFACNKLYKKELFKNIRYPVGHIYEDSYIILDLLELVERVVGTNAIKYHYIKRQDSITANVYRPKEEDRIRSAQKNLEIAESKYPALIPPAKSRYLTAHYVCLEKILNTPSNEYQQKQAEHIRVLRQNLTFFWFGWSQSFALHKSWRFYFQVLAPRLYRNLKHIKAKIKKR